MSEYGTFIFNSLALKSSANIHNVFGNVGATASNGMALATDPDNGYQTTTLSSASPAPEPDIDVILSSVLTMTCGPDAKEVTFVVSCGSDYPTGGYIELVSNEDDPVVKLGPVQVTMPRFTTSTQVDLRCDYQGTLRLKLNFADGKTPDQGATISVSPSIKESDEDGKPSKMVRIGEQTLAF